MAYEDIVREHLRITILRLLEEQGDRRLNESLIADLAVNYGFGHSRDRVRTEMAWLKEQGLVTIDDLDGLMVAELTARGEDVACGRALVPGVKRPGPRR